MQAQNAPAPDERKYAGLDIEKVEADGTFSGYASLFGRIDLGRDAVEHGAFAASLQKRGAQGIRMLFQHDPNLPIGSWEEIREDTRGLFVRGRLALGAAKAREVWQLMRDRALDGLSIGFRTVRARTEAKTGVRRILEADLWEISVVTFPMLPEARVETVKAEERCTPLPTAREFERWLTRDAGLTRREARVVIAKGFGALMRERDAAWGSDGQLEAVIRQAARMFNDRD
ncbi:HK97 family phage prohead protease [Nitratireductor sp. ZSWI3]|uniref:HK97 family phage prohead protease n=1 Tax=Nitratireductor sp. ZSWI3 TaxID=2966359 RepID=UPI00214FB97D|nr:HK97 family phage prohead protease [Nitratireductor sp. ZSWI3]MCR4265349.1 HK97 family phage prohead protease [Nitratireductor sp. ZSWI3]